MTAEEIKNLEKKNVETFITKKIRAGEIKLLKRIDGIYVYDNFLLEGELQTFERGGTIFLLSPEISILYNQDAQYIHIRYELIRDGRIYNEEYSIKITIALMKTIIKARYGME